MPFITIIVGILLIALGLEGYTNQTGIFNVENIHSITSLIPAAVGAFLAVCGLLALRPALRKQMMHMAVLVGLIGAIGGLAMSVPKIAALWNGTAERPSAVKMQLAMGVICLVYLALGVRSFIVARRARRAAAANPR